MNKSSLIRFEASKNSLHLEDFRDKNFTSTEEIVRYIFTLFAQTEDYKNIDSTYKKNVEIIKQIKKDLQIAFGYYNSDKVDKKTKSYMDELHRLDCSEIYKLCDFILKDRNGERIPERAALLNEVLYYYITDRAYCNSSLDAMKVIEVLKQYNMNLQADMITNALKIVDQRFWGSVVVMNYNSETGEITHQLLKDLFTKTPQ